MLKWFKRLVILLLAVVLLWFLRGFLLRGLASFLVVSEQPRTSQVILVLSGESPARMLGAWDLFQKRYSPFILLTRGPRLRAEEELNKRGIAYTNAAEMDRQLLIRLGVPEADVAVLPDSVTCTLEEAISVKSYFKGKPLGTILLVTSRYHSRRARMLFNRVFEGQVEIVSVPTPYDEFEINDWWSNRGNTKQVFLEYQKLIFYRLQFFWEWLAGLWSSGERASTPQTV
jgi:uncharacterized SAM-binding protein YcdF (DUF218 family)